jgi:glutathione S-transferase
LPGVVSAWQKAVSATESIVTEPIAMSLTLVIGNKNYSSWSMRPWVALKGAGIAFEETFIPLYTGPDDKARILAVTPSGKVPALIDGDITVWDSLAIIEYAAEKFPDAKLWPADVAARAHARAICAEMHSGFQALRNECGMNLHRPVGSKALSDAALQDIARVQEIWSDCRTRYGHLGPYLFGAFGAADAMYAPVVHRFRIYAIPISGLVEAYMTVMQANPAFVAWTRDGLAETILIPKFENE